MIVKLGSLEQKIEDAWKWFRRDYFDQFMELPQQIESKLKKLGTKMERESYSDRNKSLSN